MKEAQFILWLGGFLSGKSRLNEAELNTLKSQLGKVRLTDNPWTSNNTNESFPGSGKQMLHG